MRGRPSLLLAAAAAALTLTHAAAPGPLAAQGRGTYLSTRFPPEEFAARRDRVFDAIGRDASAIVQGASGMHSSTRFRQSNQFYYLTGVESANAYLLLDGRTRRATLFLPSEDAARASIDGAMLHAGDPEAVRKATGIDAVYSIEHLTRQLSRHASPGRILYTPFEPAEGASESRGGVRRALLDQLADPWDGRPSREEHFVGLLRSRFPLAEIRNLSPILDELRLIKSPRELELIRRASDLGGEALVEAMRSTRPGVREHELDALARFIFVRQGAQGEAYRAIVASGPQAWWAHHRASDRVMQDGELVLMDYCPDLGYYRCDITRQWPVNGKFSPVQRELYGFYLAYYEAILYSIKPGLTPQQIKKDALKKMDAILARTRFSKPIYEAAARKFVEDFRRSAENPNTTLGHWVGMATHDVGRDSGPLRPGMVFTIEPQFRIPEEQIYIRLEDMILITEDGVEIVSDWVPRSIDEIEKVMAEPGLLQRYVEMRVVERR